MALSDKDLKNTHFVFRIRCKKQFLWGKTLKDYIEERAVSIANYIIDNNATVRQTAKKFGISKSTVHKDDGVIIRIEFQGMRKAPV